VGFLLFAMQPGQILLSVFCMVLSYMKMCNTKVVENYFSPLKNTLSCEIQVGLQFWL